MITSGSIVLGVIGLTANITQFMNNMRDSLVLILLHYICNEGELELIFPYVIIHVAGPHIAIIGT